MIAMRRRLLVLPVTGILPGLGRAQSTWPAGPVRLVVPFPAGGPTDIVARPLAQMLAEALRQSVVVDNKGGAGGTIGAENIARSAPDGQSLLMATVGTHAINGSLYRKLSYDPVRDFTPIALVASAPVAIVVNAGQPIRGLADLVRLALERPGEVAFGSAGNGTPGHLTGALFEAAAKIRLRHIPYKGSAPAVADLVGGHIPTMFDPIQSVIAHINSGRLRALAVTSQMRSPVLPDVPTVAELGFRDFESTAWWALFAPARLPDAIATRLREEVVGIVSSAGFREKLGNLGVVPNDVSRLDLADFQRREIAKWAQAVAASGATVD
ncbi:MAG: Bug family tripartite tricarboxylate transporter substrate binding protein [Betaproteobacteria bacterium]